MEDMAQSVANKHGKALLLFSKCHQQFNSQNKFTTEMLVLLRKLNSVIHKKMKRTSIIMSVCLFLSIPESDIDKFLCHYQASFPSATITPKLHMMEDHVVDFVSQWRVGIGMLGEQGAESIHTVFNQLGQT